MPEQRSVSSKKSQAGRESSEPSNMIQRLVSETLEDMKAIDVVALDVRHLTTITDAMYVASGRSDRHVRAIADALVARCEKAGIRPLGVEGMDGGEWVLIDLSDVIVHVMIQRTRDFYDIEKLWDISRPAQQTES
jgi:ribosome-associated protein